MFGSMSTRIGLFAALCALACNSMSEETKRCHAQMMTAETMVKAIDSASIDSVSQSLSAVEAALSACVAAERPSEVEQLKKARDQIALHRQRLEQRVSKNVSVKLTPQELEELVKKGDPSCPRGQAYKHRDSGKEVRCTGLQPIAMSFGQAKAFYGDRGFKLKEAESPRTLEAEYGSEKYVFRFANEDSPPECLTIYPRPGMSWEEAVARTTGARPDRMSGKTTVDTPRGSVNLRVVDTIHKLIVHLGRCP